jgi:multiple antibiotic resistance protein
VGMAPFYTTVTSSFPGETRHRLALRVALNCLFLLCGTLVAGGAVLNFFGLTINYIRIAGGIVVFHSAWEMLNANPRISEKEATETASKAQDTYSEAKEIAFFPLTMPLTVGAGSMAIVLSMGPHLYLGLTTATLFNYLAAMAAMVLMAFCIFICYRYADWLCEKLGTVGTNVVTKLSAFLILAIGVQIVWLGIQALITPGR